MTYDTFTLARVLLTIKRGIEAEGVELTLDNMRQLFIENLPRDVPSTQLAEAIIVAGNIHQQRRLRRQR